MNLIFDEYDFYVYVQQLCWCVSLQLCSIAVDITLKYTANVGQFLVIVIVVIRTNFFTPTIVIANVITRNSFFHVSSTLYAHSL